MIKKLFQQNLITNKRASFDYEILEKFEAGIALLGTEVKSIKSGQASIIGAYAVIKNREVFLLNAFIPPYQPKNTPSDYNPNRTRKLLLQTREIDYLTSKIREQRLTLIPLRVYNKNGLIKIEIGVAKRKKKFDKREVLKQRKVKRDIEKTKLEFS